MKFLNGVTISNILSSFLRTNGSGNVAAATLSDFGDFGLVLQASNGPMNGRMTLATGVPITTADQSAITTLFYTPYLGNVVTLWNTSTSVWEFQTFTEKSVTLTGLSASTMYDLFASNQNNGTFNLVATAWTSVTVRAVTLTTQDGILVKAGSLGQRYLGTFLTDAASKGTDTVSQRWVWNLYNQVPRKMIAQDASSTSYTLVGGGGTWQYAHNSNTAVVMSYVIGRVGGIVQIDSYGFAIMPAGSYLATGINATQGATSTVSISDAGYRNGAGSTGGNMQGGVHMAYIHQPTAFGFWQYTQLEYAELGTLTFFPWGTTNTSLQWRPAMIATIIN